MSNKNCFIHFLISTYVDDAVLDLKEISGTPFQKNGKTFVQIKRIDLKLVNIKKLNIKMENLFNGNKQLGKNNHFRI